MATEEEEPGAARDENVGRKVAQAVEKQIDAGLPWLQKRTALGNFAQLGSLLVATGALVMSGIALRIGCANESNSKLSASTARARDEREIVRDALAAFRSNESALWPWQPIRQWASRHSEQLAALSAKGPVIGDPLLSGTYYVEAQRLGEQWSREGSAWS